MANKTSSKGGAPVSKKKKPKKTNWRQIILVSVGILAMIGFLLPSILPLFTGRGPATPPVTTSPTEMPEPKFQKEGELSFLSSETGEVIKKIDIEKADNDMERAFGLMYRRSMDENQGMLFLFEENEQQAFWMKNTFIPLDILFLDENQVVTTIHKNTKPMSEASLPSDGAAKYVVEVVGGFTDKFGVKVGDKINW
jgi:uncharacterized membrane protein (UPF0127 family)